jgi:hypothetical protein
VPGKTLQDNVQEQKEDCRTQTRGVGCASVLGNQSSFEDETDHTASESDTEEAYTADTIDHKRAEIITDSRACHVGGGKEERDGARGAQAGVEDDAIVCRW